VLVAEPRGTLAVLFACAQRPTRQDLPASGARRLKPCLAPLPVYALTSICSVELYQEPNRRGNLLGLMCLERRDLGVQRQDETFSGREPRYWHEVPKVQTDPQGAALLVPLLLALGRGSVFLVGLPPRPLPAPPPDSGRCNTARVLAAGESAAYISRQYRLGGRRIGCFRRLQELPGVVA
jgi:hypothetical protein